ncbi:MAG: flagellar export chaperone FliS [Gammaproteobacteria bacterium]|nr:flagellar export chaperone FliS [Gammaproteobacteria bacterium]
MSDVTGLTAVNEYQKMNTQHEIAAASPHRLVQLMMERALTKIGIAKRQMERQAVVEKGKHIGDAIGIICGLQASLNHKPDASLAGNFDALYDYMTRRLLEANLRDDPSILAEVTSLLRELKEAWDAIGPQVSDDDAAVRLA